MNRAFNYGMEGLQCIFMSVKISLNSSGKRKNLPSCGQLFDTDKAGLLVVPKKARSKQRKNQVSQVVIFNGPFCIASSMS